MSRMVIRASLAVMVTDALTGKPVPGPRIRLEGGISGLRKPEGCQVFVNLAPARYTAVVEAPFYQTREVSIQVGETFMLERVALVPGRQFPFPAGVEWLEGPGREGAAAVAQEEEPPLLRVVEPAKAGSGLLSLYAPGGVFAALQVWIRGRNAPGALFWITPHQGERDRFLLDRPLPWPVDRSAQVLPVLPAGRDAAGYPLRPGCRVLHWLDRDGTLLASQARKGVE